MKMDYEKVRTKRFFLLGVIIFTLLFSISSLAGEKEIVIPEFQYHNFQLDNGLEVYVFEDHNIPLVELSIFYKIGSIDEEEGLTGIAHFLEHCMFLGTETLPKGKVEELIKSVGGQYNAMTSYDFTYYYIEVPSSMLELAMAIEADRMVNLKLDPAEIEREREVIRQERRSGIENNVVNVGLEITQALAFEGSSLEHQVIGWMEGINNIKLEDLERYYNTYYVPNNAVMVVAGDVEVKEVERLARKYFADYESREVVHPEFKVVSQTEEQVRDIELYTNIPIVLHLYRIPEGDHPDIMGINVLLDILINNQSSRIKQELQNKEQIILETGSFLNSIRVPGFALIYYVPANEDLLAKALEAFDREVARIINEGIAAEEFKAVKKAYEKSLIFMQKDTVSMATSIAYSKLNFNKPDLYKEELAYLNQLSEEQLIEIASKYFRPENRVIGNIVPVKE